MGASRLLALQPGMVRDMLQAMRYESVCPANAGLLEAVLGSLRHECIEAAGACQSTCLVKSVTWLASPLCMPEPHCWRASSAACTLNALRPLLHAGASLKS